MNFELYLTEIILTAIGVMITIVGIGVSDLKNRIQSSHDRRETHNDGNQAIIRVLENLNEQLRYVREDAAARSDAQDQRNQSLVTKTDELQTRLHDLSTKNNNVTEALERLQIAATMKIERLTETTAKQQETIKALQAELRQLRTDYQQQSATINSVKQALRRIHEQKKQLEQSNLEMTEILEDSLQSGTIPRSVYDTLHKRVSLINDMIHNLQNEIITIAKDIKTNE